MSTNEWDDPLSITGWDSTPSEEEQRRQEISQAIAAAYDEQHKTTPLDSRARMVVQSLTETDSGIDEQFTFRAKRFLGAGVGRTYTGTVTRLDGEWEVEFDTPDSWLRRLFSLA